ncbi:PREDICTED: poly(A)-specific ribonuclease PARN-like [Camelina sativa]|uniref:Poly(A)-specific ribonuclease PARN-like n=1 Tax=Camelina sativa TaxID=90675 RepID=A0ABM0VXB8_CAMSA|nr:PREDICTED: poly(A)-specific ribonuclease PARN-like [Camelina sativa]
MRRQKQWPLRPLLAYSFCSSAAERVSNSTAAAATVAFPLKHVTRSNFEKTLNDLRALVKAADFVAIDLEMTGVTSAPWRDSLEFDRYDVRYLKVKDSAEKFAVVQFGVCPFRWDARTQSFVSHPQNFFVFPRQELTFDPPAHEFLCQTTSMDFLAKYQFDFNTCIHEGISYLSRRQEEEASKRLETLYREEGIDSSGETEDLKLVRLADVLFAERMKNMLNEWRTGLLNGGNVSSESPRISNESTRSTETVFHQMRPALSLKGFTSHQLRVINSVLGKHFGDLVYIHSNDKSSCSQDFVVYTESESDKENLMKEAKDERKRVGERKIQSAIGFRQVIDLLASEKKLIVGHNCFLDIAHVYSKFVGPLPSTAEKFVASINSHFPYIVDTKILLNVNPMLHQRMKKSSTSLSSAFSSLCPQIEFSSRSSDSHLQQRVKIDVEVDNFRCSNWNAGGKHEAGYDAFMTGCIFAQACNHLGFDFTQHSQSDNLAHNEKLEKYINRLYLSWTRGDIIDLRTGHSNADNWRVSKFKYENIVLIWNFPRKLKAREIKECICKAFGSVSVISVYHIDDSAVFLLFKNSELVWDFLKLKRQLESSDGPVSVLHPLSKILEGGNTGAADYEAYKEICSSHISEILFSDQAETVGVKSRTRPDPQDETDRREESTVAVTHKSSDLIDAFLANRVEVETATTN